VDDHFTIFSGIALTVVATLAWLNYLRKPRAMLLDATSMGWFGVVIWVGLATFLIGLFEPGRKYRDGAHGAILLFVLGLLGYAVGVAWSSSHRVVARLLPTPKDTLSVPSVWCILLISFALSVAASAYMMTHPWLARPEQRIVGAFMSTGLGSAGVLAILLITAYRRAYFSMLSGVLVLAAVMALLYYFSFSRRPIPGLAGALIAMVYHFRFRQRPLGTRILFLGAAASGLVLLILLLTATRSERFGEGRAHGLFSRENQGSLFGGMTVNVHALEYSTLTYPENHPYLMGSGLVPMFVWYIPRSYWPDKPVPSGGVISYQFLHSKKHSIANTLIGEAFINFGWIGTPIFMVLAGIVVGAVNHKLHQEQQNLTLWVAWFTIVPDWISEWRGDLMTMTIQPFLRLALFLTMAWLLGKVFPQAPRLQTSDLEGVRPDGAGPSSTDEAPGSGGGYVANPAAG
jgi:oligosaccharide repeat unit polymerase